MNKKLSTLIQYIVFLGGGVAMVWWQLSSMNGADKEQFYASLKSANYLLVIPIVAINLFSHLLRSYRWKLLMEPLSYMPKLSNVFCATMIGYMANSAVPRLGEVLKCTFLSKYEKLKVDNLVGTIIIERAFDLICFVAVVFITLAFQADVMGAYITERLNEIKGGGSIWSKVFVLCIIIALFISVYKLFIYLQRKYPNSVLAKKILSILQGLKNGLSSIKNLKKRPHFLAATLLMWFCYFLQIYLGFNAMKETSGLGAAAALAVLTSSTLAMIATPNGIGTFPLFVMQTLSFYAIAEPTGKAFGWLIWSVSTALIIVSGLISILAMPVINKNYLPPTSKE